MDPLLASFIDLEGADGAEELRRAAVGRRFGSRTLSFNCFVAVIDASAGTVTLEDAIDLDGRRAVIALDQLLRDLPG